MKKLLFSIAVASFAVSCQNDSNSSNSTNNADPVLPVKITEQGHVTTFTYNGNHLYQQKDNNAVYATYTYTGDLISQIVLSDGTTQSFIYDSAGRLIKGTDNDGGMAHTMTVTYPSATTAKTVETIQATGYLKTITANYNLYDDGSPKNGTITEVETSLGTTTTSTGTYNATYDDKNFVLINVAGMKNISIYNDYPGYTHNLLSKKEVLTSGTGNSWTIEKYSHQYNANGFPSQTVKTEYALDGTTVTNSSTSVFEYNHN